MGSNISSEPLFHYVYTLYCIICHLESRFNRSLVAVAISQMLTNRWCHLVPVWIVWIVLCQHVAAPHFPVVRVNACPPNRFGFQTVCKVRNLVHDSIYQHVHGQGMEKLLPSCVSVGGASGVASAASFGSVASALLLEAVHSLCSRLSSMHFNILKTSPCLFGKT